MEKIERGMRKTVKLNHLTNHTSVINQFIFKICSWTIYLFILILILFLN
jgi:hypothetical protein